MSARGGEIDTKHSSALRSDVCDYKENIKVEEKKKSKNESVLWGKNGIRGLWSAVKESFERSFAVPESSARGMNGERLRVFFRTFFFFFLKLPGSCSLPRRPNFENSEKKDSRNKKERQKETRQQLASHNPIRIEHLERQQLSNTVTYGNEYRSSKDVSSVMRWDIQP